MSDLALIEHAEKQRWDAKRAWDWYNAQPWLVGCNFLPSSAVNQLEMWQADTFNPAQIDKELGWLAELGMNSMRVFLHDLLWLQDAKGFLSRLEQYLQISHRHNIGTMFVFFDSVWHPFPHLGKQREPEPGVHNSFWVQSPGVAVLRNEKEWARLEDYVSSVIQHFNQDPRVHCWDMWNEPENPNPNSYGPRDLEREKKAEVVLPLMAKAFDWARKINPSQPLTTGLWYGEDWENMDQLLPLLQFQLNASDVISFHRYASLEATRKTVEQLKKFNRPLFCTEYMARPAKSTFEAILPYFKNEKVAAYNWGSVSGKTQTIYDWSSWQNPQPPEPELWLHDILRPDGSPYISAETDLIKSLLAK